MEKIEPQKLHSESVDTPKSGLNEIEEISGKEKLPALLFELIDLEREAELFYSFMKRGRFSSVFDRVYPELRVIQNSCENKDECMRKFREFLENLQSIRKEKMLAAKEQIELEWNRIGADFLKALSDHFETEWPKDKPDIVGYISNLPVFPRFLDEYQFCVGYKNTADAMETSAHEIVHFLWFKKWKEVFPEIERREYENPHLAWRLSEIMDPIILQCNPKIKELINPKKWGYSSFENIKIGDVGMIDFFKKVYVDSVASGDNFETVLRKLWKEAKEHEKEINTF